MMGNVSPFPHLVTHLTNYYYYKEKKQKKVFCSQKICICSGLKTNVITFLPRSVGLGTSLILLESQNVRS